MKNSFLTLAFTFMTLMPAVTVASVSVSEPDTLISLNNGDPEEEEIYMLNLDDAFFFQEKVYIHIYDKKENALINQAFSRKELKENKALQDLLLKSTRFMSVDRHYYYFLNE